jgi:peroxiredoxin
MSRRTSPTPPMRPLDQTLPSFELKTAAGETRSLDDLIDSGPAVLAFLEADLSPDPRMPMLRELGRGAAELGVRVAIVSAADCAAGRQLEAVRMATWLTDAGKAFDTLGLSDRRLGRTRRRAGVFVVDADRVLRFSFSAAEPDQWVPASFVLSRLSRLLATAPPAAAEPPPPEQGTADTAGEELATVPVDAEMDRLVRAVGRRLGMSGDDLTGLATACRFRDLGMAMVPDSIIAKDGPLSEEEWQVIRDHPERSADMLGSSPLLQGIREIVRASHEHLDGSGYPRGLQGDDVPFGSRVLLAVEAYMAMTQERPYREMLGMRDALSELQAYSGRLYDPAVVDALASEVAAGQAPAEAA